MKINKNIISFAICLAMFCPVKPTEETDRLTSIEETVITDIAAAATQGIISAIDQAIASAHHHSISAQDAATLLQQLAANLVDGTQFQINGKTFIVQTAHKQITAEEDSVVNSAISTTENEVTTMKNHVVSHEDAVVMLQAFANSLVEGSHFTLNDASYTVQA